MPFLKKVGKNLVPVGYFWGAAERQMAFETWLEGSLFPLFEQLQKSIIDEFKLIPQMYKYDVCFNKEWHKDLSTITSVNEVITNYIQRFGFDQFQLQIVIECFHPHISWGTIMDITMEPFDVASDDEVFTCYGIVIDPVIYNLEEPISLVAGLSIIENVLIDMRIDYVQNS